jgi:hypothetical protein
MDLLLRRLVRMGVRRGMSGSQYWLVLGVSVMGVRALRRMARSSPEILYRTEVRAGDRFEVASRRG